jgi:biotin carboxylase
MSPTRIWIGPWFNTAYHFVRLLRDNPERRKFLIFGSSHDAYSPVLPACDQVLPEPGQTGEAYAEACLETCLHRQIEVFVPGYKKFLDLGPRLDRFTRQGIRVMLCPDWPLLSLLHDKARTYQAVSRAGLARVPPYRLARTVQEFADAYADLRGQGCTVCVKPNQAQGGLGFRVFDQPAPGAEAFHGYASCNHADFPRMRQALADVADFPPLLLSEYLSGPEYSVDCLALGGRLYAAVPRRKVDARLRYLENQRELLALAEGMAAHFRLPYLFNVQFKYHDGVPKLLEINPRMSGGLYMSCMAGINLPYLAIKLLLGVPIQVPPLRLDTMVGEVGQSVVF